MAKKITTVTRKGDRKEQLESLALLLAKHLEAPTEGDNISQLAKQYRETLKELSEFGKENALNDGIGALLQRRATDGVTRAQRSNPSKLRN